MTVRSHDVINLSELGALTGMNLMSLKRKLEGTKVADGPRSSTLYSLKDAIHAIYVHGDESLAALKILREKEETRLAAARANKIELENGVLNKTLIPMEEAEKMFGDLIARFKTRLLAIPNKAAFVVASMKAPGQIEAHLNELVCEALDALSKSAPGETASADEASA